MVQERWQEYLVDSDSQVMQKDYTKKLIFGPVRKHFKI